MVRRGCTEADLTEIGVLAFEGQIRVNLANRLRVLDWHRTHPDLAATKVEAPLVLVGHAPERHDRVEPSARGRSRQPVAARVGGERVDPAADHRDVPDRPALRAPPAPRRAPST